jgi:signal peptidase II
MREKTPSRSWARWLVLSVVIVIADLASKAWIEHAFAPGEVQRITSFFNLVLVYNTGAAFSFLAGAGGWQRWFFMGVSAIVSIVIVWMLRKHGEERLLASALALVLGGALGNLYDRATIGQVVDFVQLHAAGYYWPAFNVADSAISVGVALLIWDSLRGNAAGARPPDEAKNRG